MPVDTTSETTEQQVSTVEENSLKQSKPDLPDIELPDDDPNEPTPSTSKNVLTDGLKQPLPDGVDSDKVKKIRRTEISEDKLEVTNKDDNKESHIELLLQKVSECLENTIDDESNPLLELKNKIYLTKNTDETKSIESPSNSYTNNSEKVDVCSNSIDQNVEVIDSDNSSDISLSDLTDLPEDISSIKSGVKQITKESLPQLLKLLNIKDLTVEKFERMCSLKVTESMVSKLFWSYKLSDLELLKKSIQFWQEKYKSLKKEFKELRHLVNVYKREEGNMKLPKQAIPLPRPDPVSIAVEDDDDAVELEFETVESASSSTSKITNKTTKKNGDSEETITYLELSKNPSSSSSSFITGTASRSPRRTSVLNKDTINTSPKSKKLEPISIEGKFLSFNLILNIYYIL
ncbi:uncharacterized protein LOC100573541 [Acyrthosiphon pisum]|uniref:Uncharacterized protein n=1 Tax=Acyrthosiphon pisum TaxID=7029 RepID=A0A8R2NUT4_ACYPI|nr:uncharacterized protein LOC100573541 [Acyrthosiphon pisum]